MLKAISLMAAVLLFSISPSWGEFIQLNSGEVIEGKIIARTDDEIKIDTGIGMPLTYYLDEIAQISEEPLSAVPQPTPEAIDENIHEVPGPASEAVPPHPLKLTPPKTVQPPRTSALIPEPEAGQTPPSRQPPPKNLNAPAREEQFLIDKVQKQMGSGEKTDTSTPKFDSKEDYLRYQFEKQVQLQTQRIQKLIKKLDEKLTHAFKQYVQSDQKWKQFPFKKIDPAFILSVTAGVYILYCLPFMLIVRKFHLSGLMAWIPVLQLFLLVRIAGRSFLWFFLLLIPGINVLVIITLCMDMAKRLQKPSFLGLLLIIPPLNLLILWYFAFAKIKSVSAPQVPQEPTIRLG